MTTKTRARKQAPTKRKRGSGRRKQSAAPWLSEPVPPTTSDGVPCMSALAVPRVENLSDLADFLEGDFHQQLFAVASVLGYEAKEANGRIGQALTEYAVPVLLDLLLLADRIADALRGRGWPEEQPGDLAPFAHGLAIAQTGASREDGYAADVLAGMLLRGVREGWRGESPPDTAAVA